MGKLVVVGALALLLGVFVGGLGPRAELRRARAEMAELKAAAARGGASAALPLALGVGSLMAAQQRARDRAPGPPRFVPADPRDGLSAPDPDPRPAQPERGDAGAGRRFDGKALAAAQAAADVRAAQYRAAFVQEAGLPPAGQAAMDQAIANMNEELGKMADRVASQLGSKSKLTPRDMADLGARVLDIYRKADDDFKAKLDNRGWAALDRTNFDLLTQVDLGAFERLADRVSTMDLPRGPVRP